MSIYRGKMGTNKGWLSVKILHLIFALTTLTSLTYGQPIKSSTGSTGKVEKYEFPLKSGGQGLRYLVDQNNKPFFWLGDAAWSMIAQLGSEDIDFYLNDRSEKGFSVLLVSLIEHKFCTDAPSDYYGELPFTGKPFITPNEKYFEHADEAINAAAKRNIVILLDPLYLGYDCKDEGWCAEVENSSGNDLYEWGRFVGKRYKDFSNIVWMIGGDTDPSVVKDRILAMIRGIRENDPNHLFSAHNQPESMAITPWTGEQWLTVNNVYSYDSILYSHFRQAYYVNPVMPFYLCESAYENEHNSTPQQLRSQAYQAVLCGSMGCIFGNCPIWHFGASKSWCNSSDWKTQLNNSGSTSMSHFQSLFRSRKWFNLAPDFDHQIITGGFGTWGHMDYVTAAVDGDRNTIIAYLPSKHTITANLGRVSGKQARCWWFDPASGNTILIGTFITSGYQSFTPASEGDWVLVIDSMSSILPEPGKQK